MAVTTHHSHKNVVFVLKEYLKHTEKLHGNMCLFISLFKPYRPVVNETISRWLKSVMSSAGINCSVYKLHSIRAAAVSKAKTSMVPIDETLKTAGWSSEDFC